MSTPLIQPRLTSVCRCSSGRSSASIREASRCTHFMTLRHKCLLSCILPKPKYMIQKLCRRYRMRREPTISSTAATMILAIYTPSTASKHSSSSGRKPMSGSSPRLGNGGFLRTWFPMQPATSRFIKARRITRRNCGKWSASIRKTVPDTSS